MENQEKRSRYLYVNTYVPIEEEVSVYDAIGIAIKLKKYFIATFILCFVAVILLEISKIPIYKSFAVLMIGKVAGIGELEDVTRLVTRLKVEYGVDKNKGIYRDLPILSKVEGKELMLELEVTGKSPIEAKKYIERIGEVLISDHNAMYDASVKRVLSNIEFIDKSMNEVERKRQTLIKLLDDSTGLDSKKDNLVQNLASLTEQILMLGKQKAEYSNMIDEINTWRTRFLREPVVLEKPINKYMKRSVAVATVLGLVMGMLVVLGVHLKGTLTRKLSVSGLEN